jgi:hypothetical protein
MINVFRTKLRNIDSSRIFLALVGPPSNVRVQATSDTSAVVQWDFDNGQVNERRNMLPYLLMIYSP